jgi:ketosteroid isomerase-like protein
MCDPEIEIRNWDESPAPGPFRGHEGLRRWWRTVTDPDIAVDSQPLQLEDAIEIDDDRVLVLHRLTATARHSGIELDQRWGSVITVRDGKILSAHGYRTQAEARRAAGLTD